MEPEDALFMQGKYGDFATLTNGFQKRFRNVAKSPYCVLQKENVCYKRKMCVCEKDKCVFANRTLFEGDVLFMKDTCVFTKGKCVFSNANVVFIKGKCAFVKITLLTEKCFAL